MSDKKIIALYLPQFHTFPENDEWWGKGFTEWTNTRKAKPLFKNHYQPRTPLNNNYYCLLESDVQVWQAELANKYGIYGLCYYHYWFNGKLLMEKPMENMLNNKEIKLPFCISWANESWARTWDGQEKQILIKQEYGGEKDWEAHFQYFLPFFRDERYICVDGKPLLLIYSTSRIDKCNEMVQYWKNRSVEEGFQGLHIVETLNGVQNRHCLDSSDADMVFEPIYSLTYDIKGKDLFSKIKRFCLSHFGLGKVQKYSVDSVYKKILERKYDSNRLTYLGTFPEWDNTARKGKRGVVFTGGSPKKFEENLHSIMQRDDAGEFVFVNAWNEWAEGAYLEPDVKYEYKYLESCKKAIERFTREKNDI